MAENYAFEVSGFSISDFQFSPLCASVPLWQKLRVLAVGGFALHFCFPNFCFLLFPYDVRKQFKNNSKKS